MAEEDFDFKTLSGLNYKQYKDKYFKGILFKKTVKSALILTKFSIKGRPNECIFIPFIKEKGAEDAYKILNNYKGLNSTNKVAVVKSSGLKDDVLELTLTSKGTLTKSKEKDVHEAIKDLFPENITLRVDGYDGTTPVTEAAPLTTPEVENTEEEVQGTNVKVDPKVLTEDYKKILVKLKEVQKADHDIEQAKRLFREIAIWRKKFSTLDPKIQGQMKNVSQSSEEKLKEVKKIIKVDENIGEEVGKVTQIVMDYISMDDEKSSAAVKLKGEAEEILTKIQKYCKFVNAEKLTAKCNQLQEMLAS